MVFNPILCSLSPKIVIFQEPLIVEILNKCHWIQNALNPKYTPLKPFDAFFSVKINKIWNVCLKFWFFRNHSSQRLETFGIEISMPQTLNMHHSSYFNSFFQIKINKIWNFGCLLNSHLKKKKKTSIWTGKGCSK